MHETLFYFLGAKVTTWKLVGYLGVFLFAGRWGIQMWASKKAGRPVIPALFWIVSMIGSLLCLLYFIFGKNDSVGILAYLFPTGVADDDLPIGLQAIGAEFSDRTTIEFARLLANEIGGFEPPRGYGM